MRLIYTLLLYLLLPLALLRLLWRSLAAPGYRADWQQRLGKTPQFAQSPIWVHAVSVGEVQAALPLLKRLLASYPQTPLLVTTTTPTGARHLRQSLGDRVTHSYLPYDLPFAVRQFLFRSRPLIGLIMETEIWPNLYYIAASQAVPLLLINARLSLRSARSYGRFQAFTQSTLMCLDAIAAQAPADAERFIALGAPASRVVMTGNVKFDVRIPTSQIEEAQALRRGWGIHRPLWLAASTHDDEELQVLKAHQLVRQQHKDTLLVIVPRHPERFDKVEQLCRKQGLTVVRRSSGKACGADTDVFLGDTMGELPMFYAAADVAFVGGSLVPVGGHNLLEPAAVGTPAIVGPYTFNFEHVTDLLIDKGAARRVLDVEALADTVNEFLKDPNLRDQLGEAGRQVVQANRGAVDTVLGLIAKRLQNRVSQATG